MFFNTPFWATMLPLLVCFSVGSAYSFGLTATPLSSSAVESRLRSELSSRRLGRSAFTPLTTPNLVTYGNSPVHTAPWALANSLQRAGPLGPSSKLADFQMCGATHSGLPHISCLRPRPQNAPETIILGAGLTRQHVRESSLPQQVFLGKRGDDEVAADLENDSMFDVHERKTLRKLREKMRLGQRKGKSSRGSSSKNDQQSIMERERLREKLALRGQTPPPNARAVSHIAKTNNFKSKTDKSADRARNVRPAFHHNNNQHQHRSRSPSPPRQHPELADGAGEGRRMPKSLASFHTLAELVDALEPVLASSTSHSLEDVVGAMNRMRRMTKGRVDPSLHSRQAALMRKLSGLVLQRMDSMPGKLLSLAVNAVAEMNGNDKWMHAASKRAMVVAAGGDSKHAMDIQAVAVILNGFARAGIRDEALFLALSGEAQRLAAEQPEKFGSQSVSVIVNAFAKLRITDAALFERMSAVAVTIQASEFSPQSVANILNAFARHETAPAELLAHMSAVVRAMAPEQFQSRHLSVSVNAFAKLGVHDAAFLAYMQSAILARSPSAFDVQAMANILNGYVKLQGEDVAPKLVAHMTTGLLKTPAKHFDPTSLASILNAVCKLELRDEALLARLAQIAKKIDPLLFDAQAVSTILHSFARVEYFDKQLFDRMALTVGEMQFILEAQSIALILNACAKANYLNKPLVRHLSLVARQLSADHFSTQNVDNILNSLARLGVRDRPLFEHMAKVAQSLEPSAFDAQAVAVTMNAFAKSMVKERVSQEVFDFFSSEVLPELAAEDLTPTSVSVILNAYAKTEIRDEPVIHMLCEKMLSDGPAALRRFDARNIASVLHALATLHIEEPPIVQGLLRKLVTEDPATMEPEEVSIIAWSSAVLNVQDPQVVDWLLQGLALHLPRMDANFRRQAHQFVLSCELEGRSRGVEALRQQLEEQTSGQQAVTCSRLQRDVAKVLGEMGLEFLEEFVDERSGYSVDVLMNDKVTAIEVDGPSHYARGTHTPLGNTLMKHRHLRHLGFDVRILPYWEWDELKTKEQKKEYLRALLTSTPTMIYL